MKVLGWQVGNERPQAVADDALPVEVVADPVTLDAIAVALGARPTSPSGAPAPTAGALAVAVAVEIDGSARWVTEQQPVPAPEGATHVDLSEALRRRPELSGAAGATASSGNGTMPLTSRADLPGQPPLDVARAEVLSRRLDHWQRRLLEGGDGVLGLAQLQARITQLDARLATAQRRADADLRRPAPPSPGTPEAVPSEAAANRNGTATANSTANRNGTAGATDPSAANGIAAAATATATANGSASVTDSGNAKGNASANGVANSTTTANGTAATTDSATANGVASGDGTATSNGATADGAERSLVELALADDIEATAAQLATAENEERRLAGEVQALQGRLRPAAPGDGPSAPAGHDAAAERALLDAVHDGRRSLAEAEAEVAAAGDTATVLRWGLEAAQRGPAWRAWAQPVILAVASVLVLVAVVLLTQRLNGIGIVVAVLALGASAAALFLPARPLRSQEAERIKLRLAQADDDGRRWGDEVRDRREQLGARAAAAGLPVDVDDEALRRREAEVTAGVDLDEAIVVRQRQRQVAANTAAAARQHLGMLRAESRELQERGAPAANGAAVAVVDPLDVEPSDARPMDALPMDALPMDAAPANGDPAVLRQERVGLAEELNRRRWELDRLALTRWLLTSGEPTAAAPDHAATPAERPGGLDVARRLLQDGLAAAGASAAAGAPATAGSGASAPAPRPLVVRGLEACPAGASRRELDRLLSDAARGAQILVLTPTDPATAPPAIRVLVTPAE